MSFIKKILLFFILFTIYCLLFTNGVFASEEFDTSYHLTYTVNSDASVAVEQKISLTNKLENVYASEYQVQLGTTKIKGIWARSASGDLYPQAEKQENNTSITIEFEEKVVGKDETLTFTLGYISDDYALKKGQVLEVAVPKIAGDEDLKQYQVILKVHTTFEKPIFINPQPEQNFQQGAFNIYYFEQKQLVDQSVIAFFGESQVFKFKLSYHLENKDDNKVYLDLPLPPDTPYQKLYYDDISPVPENVFVDEDGNWLARFFLNKDSLLNVVAKGSAEIFFQPKTEIREQIISDLAPYLVDLEFWETNDPKIESLAKDLKTVKNIYDFVVSNLDYDYEKINRGLQREGAIGALNNKSSAVCMEFTDLFVALARAAGIPAREVNGFAYTANPKLRPLSLTEDILHAWPEYYDQEKKLWLAVDPTWENTTGGIDFFHQSDLNHFGFVFHGYDSQYPYPPGSYKLTEGQGKDVEIDFGKKPVRKEVLNLTLDFPSMAIAGAKITGKIKIENLGNTAIHQQPLIWKMNDGTKKELLIEVLPPFSSYEGKISLGKTNFLSKGKQRINFQFKNKKQSQEIKIISPLTSPALPYIGGGILALTIFVVWLKIRKKK